LGIAREGTPEPDWRRITNTIACNGDSVKIVGNTVIAFWTALDRAQSRNEKPNSIVSPIGCMDFCARYCHYFQYGQEAPCYKSFEGLLARTLAAHALRLMIDRMRSVASKPGTMPQTCARRATRCRAEKSGIPIPWARLNADFELNPMLENSVHHSRHADRRAGANAEIRADDRYPRRGGLTLEQSDIALTAT